VSGQSPSRDTDKVWFKSPADSRLNDLLSFDFNSLENLVKDVLEDSKDMIVQLEGLGLPFGTGAVLDEELEVYRLPYCVHILLTS
jgi:hypothetical protein